MITSRAASSRLRGPRRPRRSGRPTLAEAAQLDEQVRESALTTIAEAAWRRAVDPAMVKLGRIAVTHALRFPEIARQTHAAGYSPRHQLLIDLLKRHAAKGSVVTEDPEVLAEHFLAMVSAMPARLASFGSVQSAPEQKRRIELAVRLFLRSLLVRNPNAASPALRGAPSASSAEMSR